MPNILSQCRAEIDALDEQIVDLLAKRFAVVDRVVAFKTAQGLPALIPSRVDEVVLNVRALAAKKAISPALAETLWREIIAQTIAYERRNKVA